MKLPEAALYEVQRHRLYSGDPHRNFGRGEWRFRTNSFELLSIGRNLELEHTVTVDGYCTVCRWRRILKEQPP